VVLKNVRYPKCVLESIWNNSELEKIQTYIP
jgi:hypothetical protein